MKFNFSKIYSNKRLNDKILKLLNKDISINNTYSEDNIKKKIKLCDKPNECRYFFFLKEILNLKIFFFFFFLYIFAYKNNYLI